LAALIASVRANPRILLTRAAKYLNRFSDSIDLTPWPFVLSVAITLAIA
jgi:hypothetical protein